MQSSSRLFPVALVSAELRADLYRRHLPPEARQQPDASVELVVTRLGQQAAGERRGPPVILLHGSFSNRRFWYSPRALGLGPYLARAGSMSGCRKCAAMACRFATMVTGTTGSPTTRVRPAGAGLLHPRAVRAAGALDWPLPRWGGAGGGLGGATWTRHGSLPWRCSVARVSTAHWLFRLPMAGILARLLLRRVDALSGSRWRQGRKTSRSAWRWRSCVGMGCSAASASRATTGGRGSPRSTCRYWRSPGLGTGRTRPGACHKLFEQFASSEREYLLLGREASYAEGLRAYRMLIGKGSPARGLALGGALAAPAIAGGRRIRVE